MVFGVSQNPMSSSRILLIRTSIAGPHIEVKCPSTGELKRFEEAFTRFERSMDTEGKTVASRL